MGINGIYCTFALKSSPYLDEEKRANGVEFLGNPEKLDKGASERIEFIYSEDSRSNRVPNKSIVLIVGT